MRLLKLAGLPALALALSIGSAQPAVAQFNTAVTTTDVQRLQDDIYDATRGHRAAAQPRLGVWPRSSNAISTMRATTSGI